MPETVVTAFAAAGYTITAAQATTLIIQVAIVVSPATFSRPRERHSPHVCPTRQSGTDRFGKDHRWRE